MRFFQMLTFQRARKRDLALCPAADGANVRVQRWTGSFSAALAASFAQNWFRHGHYPVLSNQGMKRIDLYIKVEVVLEEEEIPEKVAREICRQVEKIYVVRRAELSSAVVRE
jgi:hypothetical protein